MVDTRDLAILGAAGIGVLAFTDRGQQVREDMGQIMPMPAGGPDLDIAIPQQDQLGGMLPALLQGGLQDASAGAQGQLQQALSEQTGLVQDLLDRQEGFLEDTLGDLQDSTPDTGIDMPDTRGLNLDAIRDQIRDPSRLSDPNVVQEATAATSDTVLGGIGERVGREVVGLPIGIGEGLTGGFSEGISDAWQTGQQRGGAINRTLEDITGESAPETIREGAEMGFSAPFGVAADVGGGIVDSISGVTATNGRGGITGDLGVETTEIDEWVDRHRDIQIGNRLE